MSEFLVFRRDNFSFLYEKKSLTVFLGLILLSVLSILLSLSIGQTNYSVIDVAKSLIGIGDPAKDFVIKSLRLPRTLVAFFVGSSLALSGAILQGMVKNPLASPDLIGITSGGSVGALVFLTLFTDPFNNSLTVSVFYMPVFTFLGAFLASILIYFTSFKNGVTPYRLILIGIAVSGAAKALTSILIINGPLIFIAESNIWVTGSVYGTNWDHFKLLFIWFSIFALVSIVFIRDLNVQNLDDSLAIGLGTPIERKRFLLLILSTTLACGAVAVGGGIGFVGLVAPHICKKLTNSSFENILPLSILVGGIIVVLSDLAARTLFAPLDIPVGVFTAGIGAPFFIYLLWSKRK